MKNLPKFVETYISDNNVVASVATKFLGYFNMWNVSDVEHSNDVEFFVSGQPSKKFTFVKLPILSAGTFLNPDNPICGIFRSDKGLTLPVHIGNASLHFQRIETLESLLSELPEVFQNRRIEFTKNTDMFFGIADNTENNYSIFFSGSFNERIAANIYIQIQSGLFFKVGRSNRHTLNFDLKRSEQLKEISEFVGEITTSTDEYLENLKGISGTFNQFYSRIFCKGKAISSLPSKSKALYNKMAIYGKGCSSLAEFFLAVSSYDNNRIKSDAEKRILNNGLKHLSKVVKYAKSKYNIQPISDLV